MRMASRGRFMTSLVSPEWKITQSLIVSNSAHPVRPAVAHRHVRREFDTLVNGLVKRVSTMKAGFIPCER